MLQELAEYLKVDGRRVHVVERSDDHASDFWSKLCAMAPWLEVQHIQDTALKAREIELCADGAHGSMSFVGDVEMTQLRPLVEALRTLATGKAQWDSPATKTELMNLDRSVELDVIVSPSCPYCATVSAAALRFAATTTAVSVRVQRADATRLPDYVHTLPTVLADGAIVASGAVDEYTLVRQVFVYQRSVPPSSGVTFPPPSKSPTGPGVKSSSPKSRAPQASRRPRRPTAA